MIVVDASVLVGLLGGDQSTRNIAKLIATEDWLIAPELVDLEFVSALRRLERKKELSAQRAAYALKQFVHLRLLKFQVTELLDDIWNLRHNLTPYDAAYVALSKTLALPLYTRDARLASAAAKVTKIVLI